MGLTSSRGSQGVGVPPPGAGFRATTTSSVARATAHGRVSLRDLIGARIFDGECVGLLRTFSRPPPPPPSAGGVLVARVVGRARVSPARLPSFSPVPPAGVRGGRCAGRRDDKDTPIRSSRDGVMTIGRERDRDFRHGRKRCRRQGRDQRIWYVRVCGGRVVRGQGARGLSGGDRFVRRVRDLVMGIRFFLNFNSILIFYNSRIWYVTMCYRHEHGNTSFCLFSVRSIILILSI